MKTTIDIDLTPQSAFELFTDLDHCAERISGIDKLEVLTDGPVGLGTRFSETRTMFNKSCTEEMEITDFEPGERYSIDCESCGCRYHSTFSFRPKGSGTEVTIEMTGHPTSLFAKLISPLTALMFGRMMKKCVDKDMEDMKVAAAKHSGL